MYDKNTDPFSSCGKPFCQHQPALQHPAPPPGIQDTRTLLRTSLLLWAYLLSNDLWDEALDFIKEHEEDPMPFDIKLLYAYFLS